MAFNDNYTVWLNTKMSEYEEKIYEMEDDMLSFEKNEDDIINYLRDIHFSMPLGLALRRYICTKYGEPDGDGYSFEVENSTIKTVDYKQESYDIEADEINEYASVFADVMHKFNKDENGNSIDVLTKAEIKRMLKVTTSCARPKMLLISFALHMGIEDVHKFFTDILAEQTYNFRNPEEVIAYFCQSNEKYNSYYHFTQLCDEYKQIEKAPNPSNSMPKGNFTAIANQRVKNEINTVEDLKSFLSSNVDSFNQMPQTAYNEFMRMYDFALENTRVQALSNDEYLNPSSAHTIDQLNEKIERTNSAIELRSASNSEQLAKEMLGFIPRYTKKTERYVKKEGATKTITEAEFISISNGEKGQASKKVQTTTLPKEITMNLLISDRLEDLKKQRKAVTRKDLVFMKFYLMSLESQKKEAFTTADYMAFIDECNALLNRCGFSRLYAGNRYENLILLALLSSNPYEMYENILEYSFFNEPEYD